MKAFTKGLTYIPVKDVHENLVREALTVEVYQQDQMDAEWQEVYGGVDEGEDGYRVVRLYDDSKKGYIGVPRAWAKVQLDGEPVIDLTPRVKARPDLFPQKIKARNPKQAKFMTDLANVCSGPGPIDVVANASTGVGKTVSDLWLTAQLGYPTIVVCHITKIARQWRERVEQHYGKAWADKYVGWVQQDTCDFRGRLLVIAMAPSLARRNYGREFYNYFGKLTIDELHKVSSPVLSACMYQFPTRVRLGLTATNRKDALKKVQDFHLGVPVVISREKVQKSRVFVHTYEATTRLNDFNDNTLITSISAVQGRNAFIAGLIHEAYKRGRQIIGLSDRVKQLQDIAAELMELGVPYEHIGLHVGEYYTGKWKVTLNLGYRVILANEKESKLRYSIGSFDTKRQAKQAVMDFMEQEGLSDHHIADPNNFSANITEEKVKVTPGELDLMAQHCPILLASYGIFDTGTDIPRLDWGIECSPRADVVQAIGRVLRIMEGKPTPEWHTIEDRITIPSGRSVLPSRPVLYDFFIKRSQSRRKSYATQNCDVRIVP